MLELTIFKEGKFLALIWWVLQSARKPRYLVFQEELYRRLISHIGNTEGHHPLNHSDGQKCVLCGSLRQSLRKIVMEITKIITANVIAETHVGLTNPLSTKTLRKELHKSLKQFANNLGNCNSYYKNS